MPYSYHYIEHIECRVRICSTSCCAFAVFENMYFFLGQNTTTFIYIQFHVSVVNDPLQISHITDTIMWGMILWCVVDVATYTAALYSESYVKVSVGHSLLNGTFHTYMSILENKNYNNSDNSSVTNLLSNSWDCLYILLVAIHILMTHHTPYMWRFIIP